MGDGVHGLGIIVVFQFRIYLNLKIRLSSRKQLLGVLAGGSASASQHPG